MKFDTLIKKVYDWGVERKIITNGTVKAQIKKLNEETQEIVDGFNKGDMSEVKDGIGDTFVVMIMIAGILKKDIMTIVAENLFDFEEKRTIFSFGSTEDNIEKRFASYTFELAEIAAAHGSSLGECLEIAYNEIKDRTGHLTPEGIFVKD